MVHQISKLPPHVLIFPFPAQGHVNSMLKLAELLCHTGIHVTFLVTHRTHRLLLRHSTIQSSLMRYDGFRFETISDGLPDDNLHVGDKVKELFYSFRITAKPLLRDLLISDRKKGSTNTRKSINCIIADLVLSSCAIDVGEEIGIPIISYCTASTSDFWAFSCVPKLIEAGELPFKGNNLDVPIENVPGMDGFLRRRDLSSFCRDGDLENRDFQIILNETLQTPRAHALLLNTFEELEGPTLAQIRSRCPEIYTIGPLHAHLKTRLTSLNPHSNSLLKEDTSCMTWLDVQPLKSVIYVSFGSVTMVTNGQLMEFWHGLINSGQRFLWVIRPNSVANGDKKNEFPLELLEGARGRGYIVGWAPQEEVLAHKAVSGFLTHGGWNSILESIVAGVPMICWPYFGDQQINSRFVSEVWKLGLDMKDSCDRLIIEKMVRDLMDVRRKEFMQSADRMAKLAKCAISQGGSSDNNLERLIKYIYKINECDKKILVK